MDHMKYFVFFAAILTVVDHVTIAQGQNSGPIVEISTGQIEGRQDRYRGRVYDAFLGVPFAAPPLGDLRWKKPSPVEPWTGVLNTTEYSLHCTHMISPLYVFIGLDGESGEDCLYLNVWVPGGVDNNVGKQLPVMVFIYGGGFNFGTGAMYPGHALALHGDVIVVNFNYRLNVLGWLSTGDAESPGNYGLWDSVTALRWVQTNIAAFHGDPTRVTIFGQSAGGAMVSHLVTCPQAQGLFHNAIAISGSSSGDWGFTTRGLDSAIMLAEVLNCSASNTREIVECLREIDPHTLNYWGMVGSAMVTGKPSYYAPVMDGDIISRTPQESFLAGAGKDINFITGTCYNDAAGFVLANPIALPFLGDKYSVAWTNESIWETGLRKFAWTENPEELFNEIIRMYPDIYSDNNYTRTLAYTQASTDDSFAAFSNWEAVQHSRAAGTGKTFAYQFHYRQSFLVGYPEWVNGSHLDDIYSILGDPFMRPYRIVFLRHEYSELDREVSSKLMDYYTNFAHTGDPNFGKFTPEVNWKEFNHNDQNFLQQSNHFKIDDYYRDNMVDFYRFWTDYLPTKIIPLPPLTFPPSTSDESTVLQRKRFTEEDIQRGIDIVTLSLQQMFPMEEAWPEINNMVAEFVEQREQLLKMNI